jgi:hypothetical protein
MIELFSLSRYQLLHFRNSYFTIGHDYDLPKREFTDRPRPRKGTPKGNTITSTPRIYQPSENVASSNGHEAFR